MEGYSFKDLVENDLCFSLRQITRRITNLYDASLSEVKIRCTQLFLLMAFGDDSNKGLSLSCLADLLEMERTTLSRNVIPLVRRGYITESRTRDKRERCYNLTDSGRRVVMSSLDILQDTQDSVVDLFDPSFGSVEYMNTIDRFSEITQIIANKIKMAEFKRYEDKKNAEPEGSY